MIATEATARQAERIIAARTKAKITHSLIYIAVLAVAIWCFKTTIIDDTDWARIGSVANVLESIGEFLGVDWGLAANLWEPALETIMVATLGTLLGVVVCVPAIWFGALNITPYAPVTYPIARLMMTLSRSIHEIVWALFFVAAVGLGALAGVLAIAVRSIGFIAKMSAEAIEDLDPKPVEAIRAVGGSEFQVFLYAIMPQVLPTMLGVIIANLDIAALDAAAGATVGATVQLTDVRPGKYAGRVIADVWVNGRKLSDLLIAENLGRPYDGGRRQGWCP